MEKVVEVNSFYRTSAGEYGQASGACLQLE